MLNDQVSQLLGQVKGNPLDRNTDNDGFPEVQPLCKQATHELHLFALFAQKNRHLKRYRSNHYSATGQEVHLIDWSSSSSTLVALVGLSFFSSGLNDCAKLA